MIPLLALPLALPVQTSAQEPSKSILLDCVAAQAGDEAITLTEVNRSIARLLKDQPVTTAEEAQKFTVEGLRNLLTMRLEAQAGEDLGLEKAQIEREVRYRVEKERQELGIEGYTDKLQTAGMDALADAEDRSRLLYAQFWEGAKRGYAVAGRRPTTDRYIRPGELRSFYEENRSAIYPTRVRLQVLVVSSTASGGPEQAHTICVEARARVLEGEDLGDLVEEFGAGFRDTRGITQTVPVSALGDPGVRAFAAKSPTGELSEVLPITNQKGEPDPSLGFQIIRLLEREEGKDASFESPEIQERLRFFFSRERADRVLEGERAALLSEAYWWVHPRLRGISGNGAGPGR